MDDGGVKRAPRPDLRAAIYARVSSDQQAEAGTIASQVAALGERVEAEGLQLDQEMRFVDEGYSGATLIRPALERLRDVAATGAIDRLYVHSPDRLARKYAYQVLLLEELERMGVEVIFLNHPPGATAEEALLLQVQGMMAEYERAKILERSRRGKVHAARRGSVKVLGGAPYGYRYLSGSTASGEAAYEVVPEQAQVVRQIFQWVGRDGLSIGQVCRRLREKGLSSPKGKPYWDRATVWGMLHNPAYKGQAAFGKTRVGPLRPRLRPMRNSAEQPRRGRSAYDQPREAWISIPVPPTVEEALFEAVSEQLAQNRQRSRQRRRGARYLLQGLVVCEGCGYAYYGKSVSRAAAKGKPRRYAYYRCTGTDAYRFGGERVCHNRQVRTDLLDEAVWHDVGSLLAEPQRIELEYHRRLTARTSAAPWESAEHLSAVVAKVKRGMARVVDAYEEGLLGKEEFEPRMRRARERLARLQAAVRARAAEEAEARDVRLILERLEEFAQRVRAGLDQADWTMRREIIRALVKRIEIGDDGVRIVYKVNPGPSVDAPERGSLHYCWRRPQPAAEQPVAGRPGPGGWSVVACASSATRTTATSTCGANAPVGG